MPMKPLEFDHRYGELDQVISAFLGQPADDEEGRSSEALQAYLRHTWHTRPWAVAIAEQQIREYSRNPPGRLRRRLAEFYPVPDVGLPESEIQDWLVRIADHLKQSVEDGAVPPPSPPRTHWEWRARFPEAAQFLGGWFSQDMPDEFPDHDSAVRDYVTTTDPQLVARTAGELRELRALGLDESQYTVALAELGMEVDPPAPLAPSAWLVRLAERLASSHAGVHGRPAEKSAGT
ncbi:contact-dependent growth inhibition system immunity protein [Streptomyces sp. NPDC057116]|uniref:contact-dependent growth inhibition system immunity protein n=1 Tax=Streptomyces sp. NPDC057116 TaxID=3346023 RepID=UPI00363A3884